MVRLFAYILSSVIILSFLLFNRVIAQPGSQYRYGMHDLDERNRALVRIPSGSLFMAGFAEDSAQLNFMDFTLSKFSEDQGIQSLWKQGTSGPDYSYSITYSDGFLYLAGETSGPTETDALLIKSDTLGEIQWKKSYGKNSLKGESLKWIEPSADGNLLACGYVTGLQGSGNDCWVVRLDTAGNILDSLIYGSRENDYAQALIPAPDNGCWIAADTRENEHYDVVLVRLDSSLNIIWSKVYGDTLEDGCQGMSIGRNGEILIWGESVPAPNEPFDFYLIKVDSSNGNLFWQRRIGGPGADAAFSGIELSTGGYLFTGYSTSYTSEPMKLELIQTDANGNLTQHFEYGGTGINLGYHLIEESPDQFAVAGFVSDSLSDQYLLRVNLTALANDFPSPKLNFQPYPNPIRSGNELILSTIEDWSEIQLISIHSVSIKLNINDLNNSVIIPDGIPSGLYYIQACGKSGKSYSSSIIVEKDLR